MTANPDFATRISHSLLPSPRERIARARGDLAMGLPCLVTHTGNRMVLAAAETLSQERFDALCYRFGTPHLLLTADRARAVVRSSVDFHGPVVRLHPPAPASLDWFRTLSDPQFDADPSITGAPQPSREGQAALQHLAIRLIKLAELIPAVIAFNVAAGDRLDDLSFAALEASETLDALLIPPPLTQVASAPLPILASDVTQLHVFRDPDGGKEHYAIEIGTLDRSQPIMSRLHSACFTGDVLGSLKCDCGPQLQAALTTMGQNGSGVLLYLNQEGRGIGLTNKMRVYNLQAQGFDTVEANHHLGFHDDERDFRVATVMLRTLGISAIRLLTNNPAKVGAFAQSGITVVEQLPLRVGRNRHNQHYLSVKASKSGHSL